MRPLRGKQTRVRGYESQNVTSLCAFEAAAAYRRAANLAAPEANFNRLV